MGAHYTGRQGRINIHLIIPFGVHEFPVDLNKMSKYDLISEVSTSIKLSLSQWDLLRNLAIVAVTMIESFYLGSLMQKYSSIMVIDEKEWGETRLTELMFGRCLFLEELKLPLSGYGIDLFRHC